MLKGAVEDMFRFLRLTSVFVVFSAALVGCVDEPEGVVLMTDRKPAKITLSAPDGWECGYRKDKVVAVYQCVRPGDKDRQQAFLEVLYYSSRALVGDNYEFSGERSFDVAARFDLNYGYDKDNPRVAVLKKLPERLIGGQKAYGKSYLVTYDPEGKPKRRRVVRWLVGRGDGLWRISLYSDFAVFGKDKFPYAPEVPGQLVSVLDTFNWVEP